MFFIKVIRLNTINVGKHYPVLYNTLHRRLLSNTKVLSQKGLTTSNRKESSTEVDTNVKPISEKVKETTKTTSYLAIIVLGVGICGGLFYAVFNELFSSNSPNNIYSKSVKKCIENDQISDKLGYPISAYGEETRRGRRQHVTHAYYVDRDGKKHIRMVFHLKGSAHSGTANLDMVQNDSGKYEYRYLFVQVDDMFKSVIVVEDNRSIQDAKSIAADLTTDFRL
ncbi:mitochondrial import inner membrane translocase subunit Tim21 [Anthonomus grandis grandis]|uniref:mitochondrial import inner membrane translocase subunit Tim21 n=1 Tax=Anthonomus grandis grandis TaxID=2921223 RepID=UPI002166A084|nr:mitochondrial import inner membrane translocase subunit Tim21 [Anthonomus grandis grandis]